MHLFKQFAVSSPEEAARKIPVIDYGPYLAGTPGALAALAGEVKYACETVGFF